MTSLALPVASQLASRSGVDWPDVLDRLGPGRLRVQERPFDVHTQTGSLGWMELEKRADLVGGPRSAGGQEAGDAVGSRLGPVVHVKVDEAREDVGGVGGRLDGLDRDDRVAAQLDAGVPLAIDRVDNTAFERSCGGHRAHCRNRHGGARAQSAEHGFTNTCSSCLITRLGRMAAEELVVHGAREHNLKNVSVTLPRNALICITGLSGSGKSSLAFDTIYAEGQRRYVESLSAYARQFLQMMEKPDVDSIDGLSPAISIDQKTTSRNPRSTVGTVTEIYDYLRLLYARVGKPHCPVCGNAIAGQSVQTIVDQILLLPEGTKFTVNAPVVRDRKGEYKDLLDSLRADGFSRVKIDAEQRLLDEEIELDKKFKHTIEVVIDRLVMKADLRHRLTDSVETALALADRLVVIDVLSVPEGSNELVGELSFSEQFTCPDHGVSLPELEPRVFSFNSPHGACSRCTGLGSQQEIDPDLLVPDPSLSIERRGAGAVVGRLVVVLRGRHPMPSPSATRSTRRRRGQSSSRSSEIGSSTAQATTRSTSSTATEWGASARTR